MPRFDHANVTVVEAIITNGVKSSLDYVQISMSFFIHVLVLVRFSPVFVNSTNLKVTVPSGEVVWRWFVAIGRILVEVVSVHWRLHYRSDRRFQRTLC